MTAQIELRAILPSELFCFPRLRGDWIYILSSYHALARSPSLMQNLLSGTRHVSTMVARPSMALVKCMVCRLDPWTMASNNLTSRRMLKSFQVVFSGKWVSNTTEYLLRRVCRRIMLDSVFTLDVR